MGTVYVEDIGDIEATWVCSDFEILEWKDYIQMEEYRSIKEGSYFLSLLRPQKLNKFKRHQDNEEACFLQTTVEFTSFPEKYTAKLLTSSVCHDLANGFDLTNLVYSLDNKLTTTNGWSIYTLRKLMTSESTYSLNTIENLFLFGSCTSRIEQINMFNSFSFILFYSPENNCFKNNQLASDLGKNRSEAYDRDLKEFDFIIQMLNFAALSTQTKIQFDKYSIHKSTTIKSARLLKLLITSVIKVVEKNEKVLIAEEIRKLIGPYWNVICNPADHMHEITVVFQPETFLRMTIDKYELVLFHTSYRDCEYEVRAMDAAVKQSMSNTKNINKFI